MRLCCVQHARLNLVLAATFVWPCGCATVSDGIQNNADGVEFRTEFCNSVLTFVRSPLDSDGLRRAWFLPFGMSDEWIDFYAPMASNPHDEVASAFYEKRVGQLTHYVAKPGFASAIAKCLVSREGFSRKSYSLSEDQMRGSFWDNEQDRRIEIYAADDVAGILIADAGMQGDIDKFLRYDSHENRDE